MPVVVPAGELNIGSSNTFTFQVTDTAIGSTGARYELQYYPCGWTQTVTPTQSSTPTPTITVPPTVTYSWTYSPTPEPTITSTPIPTITVTPTPSYTWTYSPTPIPTITETYTPTVTMTWTPTTCAPVVVFASGDGNDYITSPTLPGYTSPQSAVTVIQGRSWLVAPYDVSLFIGFNNTGKSPETSGQLPFVWTASRTFAVPSWMTGGNFVLHYDADDNGTASINSYTVAVCDGQENGLCVEGSGDMPVVVPAGELNIGSSNTFTFQVTDTAIGSTGARYELQYYPCGWTQTVTPTQSSTPTPTITVPPTVTYSWTYSPTPEPTITSTPIPTITVTPTPSYTWTYSPTPIPTITETYTPTVTMTWTPTTCAPVVVFASGDGNDYITSPTLPGYTSPQSAVTVIQGRSWLVAPYDVSLFIGFNNTGKSPETSGQLPFVWTASRTFAVPSWMTGGNFVLHYDADDNGTASINSYTVAVCDGQENGLCVEGSGDMPVVVPAGELNIGSSNTFTFQVTDTAIGSTGARYELQYYPCGWTQTVTPTQSSTPTPTITVPPTVTYSWTYSPTPEPTITSTPIPTITVTPTPSYTWTYSPTPIPTITETYTPTYSWTISPTPTVTSTPTLTPTPTLGCYAIIDSGGVGDHTNRIAYPIVTPNGVWSNPIGTSYWVGCQSTGKSCETKVPNTYGPLNNTFNVTTTELENGTYYVQAKADDVVTVGVNGNLVIACGGNCQPVGDYPAPVELNSYLIPGTNSLAVSWTDTIYGYTGVSYELWYCNGPAYTATPSITPTPILGKSVRQPQGEANLPNVTATVTATLTATPEVTDLASRAILAVPNISKDGGPIKFLVNLKQPVPITLTLYSLSGEKVYSTDTQGTAGLNILVWNVTNSGNQPVASGLYIYVINLVDGFQPIRRLGKVVVIR